MWLNCLIHYLFLNSFWRLVYNLFDNRLFVNDSRFKFPSWWIVLRFWSFWRTIKKALCFLDWIMFWLYFENVFFGKYEGVLIWQMLRIIIIIGIDFIQATCVFCMIIMCLRHVCLLCAVCCRFFLLVSALFRAPILLWCGSSILACVRSCVLQLCIEFLLSLLL